MCQYKTNRAEDRVVSISQPRMWSTVRKKAAAEVKFNTKIAVSCINDCCRVETLRWNNFTKGTELNMVLERY